MVAMAPVSYAVFALLGYVAHICDASQVQIGGGGNLMRTQVTNVLDRQTARWPKWEDYFKSLDGLTFVEIGASNGKVDSSPQLGLMREYATQHKWKGLTIDPNPASFKHLQDSFAKVDGVTTLQLAVSDKDVLTDATVAEQTTTASPQALNIAQAAQKTAQPILPDPAPAAGVVLQQDPATPQSSLPIDVPASQPSEKVDTLSLDSLWKTHVKKRFDGVDILAIDVEGAEPKLLMGTIPEEPKPRYILFAYSRLGRHEYRAIGTNLEYNHYRYVARDGTDELHELIQDAAPTNATQA